jgi:hypothetical protein
VDEGVGSDSEGASLDEGVGARLRGILEHKRNPFINGHSCRICQLPDFSGFISFREDRVC